MRKPEMATKDRIYQRLRRSIIMGRCKPGERLNLNLLAQDYKASVTPVRDALQMLSQEGLITIKPRSGYFVTHLTLKQLRDLLELREVLELASIERAATRITDEQLEELEHIHTGYTGDDEDSIDRYTSENRRFHCLIAEASGNHELAATIGRVHDRLARFMTMSYTGQPVVRFQHEHLVEALRSRDVATARQAMLDELTEMRETTLESVIQKEGAFWRLGTKS